MNVAIRWASLAAGVLAGLLVIAAASSTLAPPVAGTLPLALPSTTPLAAPAGGDVFDGETARRHLAYIADPARRGRLTGSAGYLEAATYLAERFREIGLEPAGDDHTYFQHYRSLLVELTAQPELAILAPDPMAFRLRADFAEVVGGMRGGGTVEAPLVYVGGAIESGTYSDFRDVDVRGKVVLVSGPTEGDPGGNAIRRGAVAVLFVSRDDAGPLIHFSFIPQFAPNAVPTLLVTEPVADRLVASSGKRLGELRRTLEQQRSSPSREPLSFDTGLRVRVSLPLSPAHDVDGVNVVGLLRPAQAQSERYLIVGGHLDGVGADPDGTVYPAANDNGSGPAVTIELARTLACQRGALRHPILFVAWAGEEEGFRGSAEFLRRVAGTPLRSENIVGYINLDVVGCCGSSLSASPDNASLYSALTSAAKKQGLSLGVARGSSDHEIFTRAGIPASLLIWAQIGRIHTPTDTIDGVDAEHLRTVGSVAAQALLDLASGD